MCICLTKNTATPANYIKLEHVLSFDNIRDIINLKKLTSITINSEIILHANPEKEELVQFSGSLFNGFFGYVTDSQIPELPVKFANTIKLDCLC